MEQRSKQITVQKLYAPLSTSLAEQLQEMQIQPPQRKRPVSGMPIGRLEVHATQAFFRWDIPFPSALVDDEWEAEIVGFLESKRKLAVRVDGSKAIENAPGALRQFMGELGAAQFVGKRAWWAQVGKRKHFRENEVLIRSVRCGMQRKG